MGEYSLRVSGAEPDVEAFRRDLAGELRAAGIPADAVEISAARPAPIPLSEPAPLGHVEWVEVAVKIVVGVITPALAEVAKALVKRFLEKHAVIGKEDARGAGKSSSVS
jgi:hypothetical protein